ncbi:MULTISPECIES: cytochrome b/b6 domain-containing protein [unclassified Arthrobacter]|uniref:cytochrome b/b6 domain-containing protein n=1 Tax=unclassified Arthrobacter TaxID=235627 RepID=UPI002882E8C4|nr:MULTISPECIES: cytochrome b/b6 domain-containing protein [unclassified Arthrobacter]
MASRTHSIRRGLPRFSGGESWPEAGKFASDSVVLSPQAETTQMVALEAPPQSTAVIEQGSPVRRGLPRVSGGVQWPPTNISHPVAAPAAKERGYVEDAEPAAAGAVTGVAAPAKVSRLTDRRAASGPPPTGVSLRRGLPRRGNGEPWPPEGFGARLDLATSIPLKGPGNTTRAVNAQDSGQLKRSGYASGSGNADSATVSLPNDALNESPAETNMSGGAATEPARDKPEVRRRWSRPAALGLGIIVAAALAVLFVRWLLELQFMQDFVARYPGEYHLPALAPIGLPAWLSWQHFFNMFFLVMIVRTGLTVRYQKRPPVVWASRRNKSRKISLALWLHQSLDLLWLVNGFVFVVLLVATGQWMRIVPTSWEVFPNALTAALKYVSLNWPTENGWVNYNSLQQLSYFVTVFIAAPLAAVTGVRMSGVWPASAKKLSKAYSIEMARALHFPTMIYFVGFTVAHITLVLATGALRNLNHMYAATDGVSWTGFWFFIASLTVVTGAWFAARPLVIAAVARLFGTVSRG